jgi:hypothetical protein
MWRIISNFFQNIVSPKWNNRVLLALWILTIILLINAILQGGGEPLGLKALREIDNEPIQISETAKFYYSSAQNFAPNAMKPSSPLSNTAGTWFWWKLWLLSFILAIVFIPVAFQDEVISAWHWAQEKHEQRRFKTSRIKEEPQTKENGEKTTRSPKFDPRMATPWGRFKERVAAVISADVIVEFAGNLVKRVIGERIIKKLK